MKRSLYMVIYIFFNAYTMDEKITLSTGQSALIEEIYAKCVEHINNDNYEQLEQLLHATGNNIEKIIFPEKTHVCDLYEVVENNRIKPHYKQRFCAVFGTLMFIKFVYDMVHAGYYDNVADKFIGATGALALSAGTSIWCALEYTHNSRQKYSNVVCDLMKKILYENRRTNAPIS